MDSLKKHPEILIRLMVGLVFVSEGIQKFLFAEEVGAGRFTKIGLPYPEFLGPFVGTTEIVFGALVLIGWRHRYITLPLLGIMKVTFCSRINRKQIPTSTQLDY